MAFLDKALGKTIGEGVTAAGKAIAKAVKKESPRVKQKVTPKMKAPAPKRAATPRPVAAQPTPVRPMTPAKPSPFTPVQPIAPKALVIPPSRNVRTPEQQVTMAAARGATPPVQPRAFGTPSRVRETAPTTPTPIGGPSPYAIDGEDVGTAALRQGGFASTAVTPPAPRVLAETAEEAVTPAVAEEAARAGRRFLTGQTAFNVAAFAPSAGVTIAEGQGVEVPTWLKTAANIGLLAGSAGLVRKARPLLSAPGRAQIKNLPGKLPKARAIAAGTVLPAIGATTAGLAAKSIFTPPAAAEAEAALPEELVTGPSVLAPLGGEAVVTPGLEAGITAEQQVQDIIDSAIGKLESGQGTVDDANTVASGQKSVLDNAADQAMAALEQAYGGTDAVNTAVAAGDPILLQQLAGIDADYKAGMLQIQANYAGALGQVEGYQAQADALLKDVAAKQMAGFEAAAGGLEAMSPGVGLTGPQAAAAGVSDTALGGAGITGAALARGLAGAASSQAAADRLRLGTDLAGQLATGRLAQADLETALSRAALGEKAAARTESAQRESEARTLAAQQKRADAIRISELKYQAALDKQAEAVRKAENEAARKQRIAELKMNAELDLAKSIANMTPEELAAFRGSAANKGVKTPSWYGKPIVGDINQAVKVPGHSLGTATIGDIQNANDVLDAALQDPKAMDPTLAFKYWAGVYDKYDKDTIALLTKGGRPNSASAMVKTLFSTPAK